MAEYKSRERQRAEKLYEIEREQLLRKGRKNFFNFCQILSPDFYKPDRWHLWLLANTLQALYERHLTKKYFYALCTSPNIPEWVAKDIVDWDRLRDNHVYTKLMINLPPRSGKSRTLVNFCDWILGKSLENHIITVSYNTDLASNMSRYVRDGIMTQKNQPTDIVYSDIFPKTKVAKGNSSFMRWALEGAFFSYLGTGLEGTITGLGANCLLEGTLVATDKGEIPIEWVCANVANKKYKVLSFDFKANKTVYKRVVAERTVFTDEILELKTLSGKQVNCSKEHRFYNGVNFITADSFTVGDDLFIVNGQSLQADKIVSIKRKSNGKFALYDMQVEDTSNFFAEKILTHNCTIIDDVLKNASEAYNQKVLDDIYAWYTQTFLSRSEHSGAGSIDIINFTRWATGDLCGRILNGQMSKDWINLLIPVEHNGEIYCEGILPRKDFEDLREYMDSNIFQANYYQKPLDVEGRLFDKLKTYDKLPEGTEGCIAYCDTADEGSDYLACVIGVIKDGEGYITDVYFTQDNMEITEPETARRLVENKVNNAKIESNNGGKGFARNVEKIIWDKYHTKQVNISWFHQTENKKARILTGSTFIINHVYFPEGWDKKYPEFYAAVMGFSKEGKNKHDDGVEALVEWGKMISGDGSFNSYLEMMKRMQEGKF